MIYMLQASLTLALLYSIYWLAFRRTGLHRLNRLVLIGIAVASLALPILASRLPDLTPLPNIKAIGFVKYNPYPSLPGPTSHLQPIRVNLGPVIIAGLYLFGLTIFLIRLIDPIVTLIKLIRKSPTQREATYTLVQLTQPSPPFSFFRYLFLHKAGYPEAQQKNILLHEQVHIRQHHTLDILFMELYTAIFWFNPFAWQLNRQTKLNLEYLADQQILNAGVEPKEYQYQLLQMSIGPSFSRMANYFNKSHLQKRITMINSTTRRNNRWKYLLLAPALIGLTLVFAPGTAQTPIAGNARTAANANSDIYFVIRPDISESLIRQAETELAAEGINLAVSELSYTTGHQLSGFHIKVSNKDQKLEDLTITATGEPLSQPVVFYWLRSLNGTPTLTRGYPGDLDSKRLKMIQNLTGILKYNPSNHNLELHGSGRFGD